MSTAPLLWYTDRTRYKLGVGRCEMARYLSFYFGPTGYGITLKSDSLPLATGLAVHDGVEPLACILRDHDRLPTVEELRYVIAEVQAAYVERCTARGYRGILGGVVTEETIKEQSALISGLLWAVQLKFFPWFHTQFKMVLVEQERSHFLDCTCGAGLVMPIGVHIEKGCQGKVLQLRNDLLGSRRESPRTHAYFEIKTTGWESDAWAEQWETNEQLGLGTLDLERFVDGEVSELYIVGLSKGARKKDKYGDDASPEQQRRKQQSPLCYGYCRPGNPPLAPDNWLPAYEWQNEHGEVRRASKAHKRRGIWQLAESDDPTWVSYHQQDPSMPPEEYWVRTLPESVLDKTCFVLGPMNRQDQQILSTVQGMRGEEARWQEILWELYEADQQLRTEGVVNPWADDRFQSLLDSLVPKSWQCRPFGKEHQCEHVGICHRQEGWQDPLGSGKWVPRLPHHSFELEQAIARGLLPEAASEVEDQEER